MRHATSKGLDRLEPLLGQLRALEGLRERTRGVFYRGARAFLHFHEDPTGLFADVRLMDDFERFQVSTKAEQRKLVARVRRALGRGAGTVSRGGRR